ncbi:MAG: hypothetical protein D6B27_06795 [Gammaproteobacteria bacterium]|nr:MAG: hypothetical protein D6B27_06795 [Gammaproteobacteria bacterium]
MNIIKGVFLVMLMVISGFCFAGGYEPEDISAIRAQYNLLVELKNSEEISDAVFTERAGNLRALAQKKFQISIESLDLQQIVPARKIDWLGSAMYVISAILVFALLIPLYKKFRIPLKVIALKIYYKLINNKVFIASVRFLVSFFRRFWELLSYLLLFAVLWFFRNEFVVLLVALLLGSLIGYSILVRGKKWKKEGCIKVVSYCQTLIWGGMAYLFGNGFVGFLAVASFVSSIGFMVVMYPGMISIGFIKSDRASIAKLTAIAFLLSVFSWLIFYTGYIPQLDFIRKEIGVFRVGMVSLVPMVFFVGLGYMTFFLYKRDYFERMILELNALMLGGGVLLVAFMYEINSMFWIGAFFMIWDIIDKYYELVYKKVDFVWFGLSLAAVIGGAGYIIKSNIANITAALSFLGL